MENKLDSMNPLSRIALGALIWLILVTGLHYWLNPKPGDRKVVSMGYMPVITNIAAPLLDHLSKNNNAVYFQALKFSSFAEMAEALRHGNIQAAFMIAPLSIVLRQQGEDVKVIYIGNRHESTLVARKNLHIQSIDDLAGKTVAVPMRYSGHNIALLREIEKRNMAGSIHIVEMNPPDMASAMATGVLDAYFVGEPFAAQTIRSGEATVVHYVEDLWPDFICNLLLVRQDFIDREPRLVQLLVKGAIRSGLWAEKNPDQTASIVSQYWNQPVELVTYALTEPQGRILYNHAIPEQDEMQEIADLMRRYNLITDSDIADLVDDRFARSVDLSPVDSIDEILPEINR